MNTICNPLSQAPGRVPSWLQVARTLAEELELAGYRTTPRDGEPCAVFDEIQSVVVLLAGLTGRVLAEHPGATLIDVDIYEHSDIPGRAMVVAECSTSHLFGVSVPAVYSGVPLPEPDMSALPLIGFAHRSRALVPAGRHAGDTRRTHGR